MDGKMNRQTKGQTDGWKDEQTDEQIDGQKDKQTWMNHGKMNRRTEG